MGTAHCRRAQPQTTEGMRRCLPRPRELAAGVGSLGGERLLGLPRPRKTVGGLPGTSPYQGPPDSSGPGEMCLGS